MNIFKKTTAQCSIT